MFSATKRDGALVIDVDRDVDDLSGSQLESAIAAAQSESSQPIVVSFERCPYCDSRGLDVVYRASARLGERLVLVVPRSSMVFRTFEITGLVEALKPYETLAEALPSSDVEAARIGHTS